jgi:PDZ domain-containing protein
MRTAGGSTRQRAAYSAIAVSAAVLIALLEFGGTARAADAAAAADTATAAAMYEPAAPAVSRPPASVTASPAATPDATAPEASDPEQPAVPATTTETVIVPASMPAPTYVRQSGVLPPSTTEIPQSFGAPEPGTAEIDRNAADAQVINYEAHQNPQMIDPQLHSLQEFINEGDESSPLGMELREEQRKLNTGEVANGLLIVGVRNGSAAAKGGLHACQRTARNVLQGAAVAAALFFPPAVLAVPMLDQVSFGESYDMIIGVDGTRVANFLDFEDRMRDVQPGEIVYLSIVRNGDRVQVPVHVESLSLAPF